MSRIIGDNWQSLTQLKRGCCELSCRRIWNAGKSSKSKNRIVNITDKNCQKCRLHCLRLLHVCWYFWPLISQIQQNKSHKYLPPPTTIVDFMPPVLAVMPEKLTIFIMLAVIFQFHLLYIYYAYTGLWENWFHSDQLICRHLFFWSSCCCCDRESRCLFCIVGYVYVKKTRLVWYFLTVNGPLTL